MFPLSDLNHDRHDAHAPFPSVPCRSTEHCMQAVAEGDSQEGPMLWAVEALVEPITMRLRYHFASASGSMNQPEHPEWLFKTALRYAHGLAPALEQLQDVVAAHGLQGTYHLPFELARALRASIQVDNP